MRRAIPGALLLCLGLAAPEARATCPDPTGPGPVVEMVTTEGSICLEMLPDEAPGHVTNFLGYVDRGDYDGTFVHRSLPGFVIQGGGFLYDGVDYVVAPNAGAIPGEPGGANVRGTVAIALSGDPPNIDSGSNQWFINLDDNSSLDGDFTVFARVVQGLDVADAINGLPRVDGRVFMPGAEVPVSIRGALGQLPLRSVFDEDPAGYGCFDPDDVSALGFIQDSQFIPNQDPVLGNFDFVSNGCASGNGLSFLGGRYHLYAQVFQLPLELEVFSTAEATASDEGRLARRDHVFPQIPSRLVEIVEARVVPEPAASGSALAALLALLALRRSR